MAFKKGNKVIHCSFGLGEIVEIEEKYINGLPTSCYVVRTSDMTIWVPIDGAGQNSLRTPTPPDEFMRTLPILTSPNESLDEDRVLRKNQLLERLKDGKLTSICTVVRDLTSYQKNSKLNDQEKSILERAVKSLLTEWSFSLNMPASQATMAMESMLHR